MFQRYAPLFDAHPDAFSAACRELGGIPTAGADIAFLMKVFDFLPLQIRLWRADEEFPASLQLLWDENTLQFVHFETTYYMAAHLLEQLRPPLL